MSSKTEYLQLVKEDKTEAYNVDTVNANLDKIDSGVKVVNGKVNSISDRLTKTDNKVNSINLADTKVTISSDSQAYNYGAGGTYLKGNLNNMAVDLKKAKSDIGTITALNTSNKSNLVNAINSVNTAVKNINLIDSDIKITESTIMIDAFGETPENLFDFIDSLLKAISIFNNMIVEHSQLIETNKSDVYSIKNKIGYEAFKTSSKAVIEAINELYDKNVLQDNKDTEIINTMTSYKAAVDDYSKNLGTQVVIHHNANNKLETLLGK